MAAVGPTADCSTTCGNCGEHVSEQFARVYGDNRDDVHRCGRCDSWGRISEGSAAGQEVPTPDRENHPERAPSGQFGWSV